VSLAQMKVMSAIERCRTAALGGHVPEALRYLTWKTVSDIDVFGAIIVALPQGCRSALVIPTQGDREGMLTGQETGRGIAQRDTGTGVFRLGRPRRILVFNTTWG
jgi:hypothetical protein